MISTPRHVRQPAWRRPATTVALAALAAMVCLAAAVGGACASERVDAVPAPAMAQLAQAGSSAHGTEPRELQPRYEPVPTEPEPFYDPSYIFALTRGVTTSTMVAPVKVLLLPLTIPLDIALLPFAAIGGLF